MTKYTLLLALVGLVDAAPAAPEDARCRPHTICVTKVNSCGVRYGGCYDVCKTANAPVAPPCTSNPVTVTTTSPTSPPVATSTDPPIICVDYVNPCGQTYGGCFPSTSPFPTFTAPSCSITTTPPPTNTTTTTAVPTICVDYVNPCGQTYGGCFASTSPFPTFTAPSCSLTTTTPPPTSTTTTTAVQTICVDYVNPCGQTYGGCFASTSPFPTFTAPSCSLTTTTPPLSTTTTPPPTSTTTTVPTICVDYVNPCGQTYGGCFASTSPFPTFTAPSCSLTTTTPPSSTTSSPTSTPTICVDYINSCGATYGGCFLSTTPWPVFTPPPCPSTTTTPITSITTNPTITQQPTTTAVPTICIDKINSCGKTYGGCFASTSPFPTFSEPPCP